LFGGKWTDNTNDAHVRAFGHLHVFGRVTYINALRGFEADALEREIQRAGVWLLVLGVTAAHASVKSLGEAKFAELTKNAVAVSASDQTQFVAAAYDGQDLSRARD
jgi:hypothetical protein